LKASNLRIICYPHPTLRHVSKPLQRVDAELRRVVARMFELMYAHRGVGLAANQVDLPYRVFVTNIEGDPEKKENERVYINPVLSRAKGTDEAEEGCLSIPGVNGDVKRAETITVRSFNFAGEERIDRLGGLAARIVQHEIDHLNGTLFIDRLTPTSRMALREQLSDFELEFRSRRALGEIPEDGPITDRLMELEKLRT